MSLRVLPPELAKNIRDMGLEIIVGSLSALIIQPILYVSQLRGTLLVGRPKERYGGVHGEVSHQSAGES